MLLSTETCIKTFRKTHGAELRMVVPSLLTFHKSNIAVRLDAISRSLSFVIKDCMQLLPCVSCNGPTGSFLNRP